MRALKFKLFPASTVIFSLALGLFSYSADANPYKEDEKAEALRESRRALMGIKMAPTGARAHRKAVLEALEKESGRDRAKEKKAVLRVAPRKKAERTNVGFQ